MCSATCLLWRQDGNSPLLCAWKGPSADVMQRKFSGRELFLSRSAAWWTSRAVTKHSSWRGIGVFEFMSDEEVVDVVCNGNAADAEEACSQVCISVHRMCCPLKKSCEALHLQWQMLRRPADR